MASYLCLVLYRRMSDGPANARQQVTPPPTHAYDCTGDQVMLSSGGGHVAGSPFPVRVSPGQAYAGASVCDDCEVVFSTAGDFTAGSTKLLSLSTR